MKAMVILSRANPETKLFKSASRTSQPRGPASYGFSIILIRRKQGRLARLIIEQVRLAPLFCPFDFETVSLAPLACEAGPFDFDSLNK